MGNSLRNRNGFCPRNTQADGLWNVTGDSQRAQRAGAERINPGVSCLSVSAS